MIVGVGDRGQVVLGIVGVVGGAVRRIGDGYQPVGIVVGVGGGLVVLVGDRGPGQIEYVCADLLAS